MEQDVTIVHRAIACAGKAAGVSRGQSGARRDQANEYQSRMKGARRALGHCEHLA
jgi:hypothetical protein